MGRPNRDSGHENLPQTPTQQVPGTKHGDREQLVLGRQEARLRVRERNQKQGPEKQNQRSEVQGAFKGKRSEDTRNGGAQTQRAVAALYQSEELWVTPSAVWGL